MRSIWKNRPRRVVALPLLLALALFTPAGASESPARAQRPKAKASEAWRRFPPKPGPARPLTLPAPREVRLDNGLKLVLVEDHRAPVVTFLAVVPWNLTPSADMNAMTNEVALAEATGELLTEGAGSRTSEQLAREVETLGGRISSVATDDYAEVSASVISVNAERMMELFADVLLRPDFPEDEIALHKRNRIQTLVVQRQDPAFLAEEQFDRVVFGSHPYAISSPTPASVDALDRGKIRRFYEGRFSPAGSVVVVVGDLGLERMEAKARALFGDWKRARKEEAREQAHEFAQPKARVYLVNRPGSEQADFRIGGLGVTRADPDYFALLVANAVLGAGTNSRLFLNIRERKGFAYDVYSSVDSLRYAGTFFAGAETRTEVTARAIREMLGEFDRLHTRVSARELEGAKNYLNGLFSIGLSTQGGIASRLAQIHLLSLGSKYLETYRARIEAVTAAQVEQAARKYIRSDRPVVVVVGDASKLKRQLESIGSVEVVSLEGSAASQADR